MFLLSQNVLDNKGFKLKREFTSVCEDALSIINLMTSKSSHRIENILECKNQLKNER